MELSTKNRGRSVILPDELRELFNPFHHRILRRHTTIDKLCGRSQRSMVYMDSTQIYRIFSDFFPPFSPFSPFRRFAASFGTFRGKALSRQHSFYPPVDPQSISNIISSQLSLSQLFAIASGIAMIYSYTSARACKAGAQCDRCAA